MLILFYLPFFHHQLYFVYYSHWNSHYRYLKVQKTHLKHNNPCLYAIKL